MSEELLAMTFLRILRVANSAGVGMFKQAIYFLALRK